MNNTTRLIAETARARGLYAIPCSSYKHDETVTVYVYRRLGLFMAPLIEIEQAVNPAAIINSYFDRIEDSQPCTAATLSPAG